MIDMIAFDADDTLWHNETLYTMTQERFKQLLSKYRSTDSMDQTLYRTEMQNLEYFGYGIKGFTLSMIETAIELTGGQIEGGDIQTIVDFSKEMVRAPVRLLEHVEEVVTGLAGAYRLMIITKGDLFDQESKIARSGLAVHFDHIEIVSDKRRQAYEAILSKHELDPNRFLMVGNSLRSDIWPVVELGAYAVHIPYHTTWDHEKLSEQDALRQEYFELEHLGMLPALLEQLDGGVLRG